MDEFIADIDSTVDTKINTAITNLQITINAQLTSMQTTINNAISDMEDKIDEESAGLQNTINNAISDMENYFDEIKGLIEAGLKVDVPVGTTLFSTSSTTTFFNVCFGGTWDIVGNIDAIVGGTETLTLYMFRKISNS